MDVQFSAKKTIPCLWIVLFQTFFLNGEECPKEDNIIDWNSTPIYDEYPDEDCELDMGRKIVEDDDQSIFIQGDDITHIHDEAFFVQIQKVNHFTKELFRDR